MELLLAFLLIIFSLFILLIVVDASRPPAYPQGPAWLPMLGCYLKIRSLKSRLGYYHLVWSELARQYGPLVGLRLGRDRIVVVSGHHMIQHVLAREDCDGRADGFVFRMRTFNDKRPVASLSEVAQGAVEEWQEHRHFTTLHLRHLGLARDGMETLILKESRSLVDMLKAKCTSTEGTEMQLNDVCQVSVMNVLWILVAGERFELEDLRFRRIYDLNTEVFRRMEITGGLLNHLPFLRYLAPTLTGYTELKSACDEILRFLQQAIEDHKKTFNPEHTRDLIDTYLKEIKIDSNDPSSIFTEESLISVCMDLFLAGTETTSSQLAFFILLMMHHTDVQVKIQQEIDENVGKDRQPCIADRPMLPYLCATIMEVERFTSVVPTPVPHKTTKDCRMFGYSVPKNTMLLLNLWSVHMDVNHWGDPHVFRPERFLDVTRQKVVMDDWLMPFGSGRRSCLGEDLAKNNLYLFLASLMQNFTFDVMPNTEPPSLEPLEGLTLAPQPFKGLVTPR